MTRNADQDCRRAVVLLGSPRAGGNSDTLATTFVESLTARGFETKVHALRDLNFAGCRNLFHCKTGGESCGQADDFSPLLAEVAAAELLVLASPIYFTDLTSTLKAAIERFFSYLVPGYPTAEIKTRLRGEKSLVLIQVQGEGQEAYGDLLTRYEKGFRMLGFSRFHLLHAWGLREAEDLAKRPALFDDLDRLAETL